MVSEGDSSTVSAGAPGPLGADALAELRARALDQVGAAIILADAGGTIVDWSPGATRLFGWSRDEALGRTWADLAGPVADDPDPRRAIVRDGLAEGRAYSGELTVTTKAGARIPIVVDGNVIVDDHGQVIGSIGIAIDDRRRTAAEERFEVAFYDSPIPSVITVAPRQLILDVNPAFEQLAGYARHDAIGRTSNELDLWASEGMSEALLELTEAGAPIDSVPVRVRHASGEILEARISGRPIALSDGPAYLWMAVDETERVRAEREARALSERLYEAEKMESIGHLAGGIAHDFNNLMTSIAGFSAMAIDTLGPSHPVTADLREVTRATERASGLTRQLMAFSRRQVIQPHVMDLQAVVGEALPALERLVGGDVTIEATGVGSVLVEADQAAIGQVLTNLAVNAREAMPSGGTLSIATVLTDLDDAAAQRLDPALAGGRYVQISVSDTGIGMPAETLERAFEPFFSTKPGSAGAGLGLSVVHGIVKQLGGHVGVTSEPGRGTDVTISLPVAGGHRPAATDHRRRGTASDPERPSTADVIAHAPPDAQPDEPRTPLVLVAEDEPAIRMLAARILERAGYRVVAAEDGRAALAVAAGIPHIDALVTDLTMPHLGGVELAAALRAARPGLPVVYMSGYGEERLAEDGILAADVRLLQKPFDVAALAAAVDEALAEVG